MAGIVCDMVCGKVAYIAPENLAEIIQENEFDNRQENVIDITWENVADKEAGHMEEEIQYCIMGKCGGYGIMWQRYSSVGKRGIHCMEKGSRLCMGHNHIIHGKLRTSR
jgi:hypothetical protein